MKHILLIAHSFMQELSKRNVGAYAGSIAFFFLLSMIPLLILLSMALPLIGYNEHQFTQILVTITPEIANARIETIIHEVFRYSSSVLPITILALIWSCARGMLGLMYGLNCVYNIKDNRNYFILRLLATFYMLLLIVLFLIMLVSMVFGQQIQAYLNHLIPYVGELFGTVLQFRYLIVIIGGVTILSLIYKLVPYENQPLIEQVPGACFTVIAWILFSKIFSTLSSLTTTSVYYGSLTVLIVFLFWLYWCIYIILIGGYINWYFRYVFRILLTRIKQKRSN